MTYFEKLKDPRWQKRRLEILNRANFMCQACGDNSRELHVHHTVYRKGSDPWDYRDYELLALCKDCHESAEQVRAEFLSILGCVRPEYPLLSILEAVKAILLRDDDWKINQWCECAYHPDLMEEAQRRYVEKLKKNGLLRGDK